MSGDGDDGLLKCTDSLLGTALGNLAQQLRAKGFEVTHTWFASGLCHSVAVSQQVRS